LTPWELGRLCLAEATWEESSRYLEECIATARQSGDLQALRLAQATLAERDLLQRRPAAAYARLAPLLDRPGLAEWQVTELLPVLAWAHLAHLELGEAEQAADVASRAVGRARAQGDRLSLVEALRVQGLVALRQERWDDAVQVQEEAASARERRMRYPYGEARVLHVYGAAACAKGGAGAGMSAAGGGAGDLYASGRASGSRADRAGGGHHALTALARGPDGTRPRRASVRGILRGTVRSVGSHRDAHGADGRPGRHPHVVPVSTPQVEAEFSM
jgi:tetratricopeptide (TPR) repeat protein